MTVVDVVIYPKDFSEEKVILCVVNQDGHEAVSEVRTVGPDKFEAHDEAIRIGDSQRLGLGCPVFVTDKSHDPAVRLPLAAFEKASASARR